MKRFQSFLTLVCGIALGLAVQAHAQSSRDTAALVNIMECMSNPYAPSQVTKCKTPNGEKIKTEGWAIAAYSRLSVAACVANRSGKPSDPRKERDLSVTFGYYPAPNNDTMWTRGGCGGNFSFYIEETDVELVGASCTTKSNDRNIKKSRDRVVTFEVLESGVHNYYNPATGNWVQDATWVEIQVSARREYGSRLLEQNEQLWSDDFDGTEGTDSGIFDYERGTWSWVFRVHDFKLGSAGFFVNGKRLAACELKTL